jgi:predicted O-methyltransferase YrrM
MPGSLPRTKPAPGGRLGELGGVLSGYAGALVEQLFTPRPTYETIRWQEALADLGVRLGDVDEVLKEPALRDLEESTRRLLADIQHGDTFTPYWAADSIMARLCYLACRLIEPEIVVETGVAYGVSSAFILRALEINGHGTILSADLQPLRGR